MDWLEMSKAYNNAKKQNSVNDYPNGYDSEENGGGFSKQNFTQNKPMNPQPKEEFDYSIVRMSSDRYIIARSRHFGSLDYEFLCECNNHWEATQIVKALSK
jgi:hypothetical protein